jgi:hypothetical protein
MKGKLSIGNDGDNKYDKLLHINPIKYQVCAVFFSDGFFK